MGISHPFPAQAPAKAEKRRLKSAQAAKRGGAQHVDDVAASKLADFSYAERMGQFKRKLRVNDGQWKTGAELAKAK